MRKTERKKSRTISLRVSEDFYQRIQGEARRRKISRTALLLEKWRLADAPTFGTVAG